MSGPHASPDAPPSLGDVLADAVRLCPQCWEVLLVDAEGVTVAHHRAPSSASPADVDHEELAVEATTSIPALAHIAASARLGAVSEWAVHGDRGVVLVRRVPQLDLLLILCASPEGWTGRARFAARVTAGRLAEILAAPAPPARRSS